MPLVDNGFELVGDVFAIRAAYEPGDINQITVEEQWPTNTEYAQRGSMARTALRQLGLADESPWIRFVAPGNVMERFGKVLRFEGLLQALGYELHTESSTSGDQAHTHRTMRYPSVERANRIKNELIGSNSLTAVRYEGGEFDAFESIAAFVNEGEEEGQVWVASDPPFEVHDMADHVLADLVTDRSLNEYLRTGWGQHLTRARVERQLPPLPLAPKDEGLFHIFHPSWSVVFNGAQHREDFTGRLSNALFFKEIDERARSLAFLTTKAVEVLRRNIPFVGVNEFGDFPNDLEVAQAIIERCQRAEATVSTSPLMR
jgi:hypothetical protein